MIYKMGPAALFFWFIAALILESIESCSKSLGNWVNRDKIEAQRIQDSIETQRIQDSVKAAKLEKKKKTKKKAVKKKVKKQKQQERQEIHKKEPEEIREMPNYDNL